MVTRVSRVGGGSTTSRRRSADDGCGAPSTATRATKIVNIKKIRKQKGQIVFESAIIFQLNLDLFGRILVEF